MELITGSTERKGTEVGVGDGFVRKSTTLEILNKR